MQIDATPITRETTCAVIVSYHPDAAFPERLAAVRLHAHTVVIVDNHSNPTALSMLRRCAGDAGVQLIENAENLGIATALNQGLRWADAQGYGWVMTLDQDTQVFPDYLATMSAMFAAHPTGERVGILACNYRHAFSGQLAYPAPPPEAPPWLEVACAITSGSLHRLAMVREIGGMRDEYFIDNVDIEYCFRARKYGYQVILAPQPLITHSLGAPTPRRFLWRTIFPLGHAPLRRYYMIRNFVALAREYGTQERPVLRGIARGYFKDVARILCVEDQRAAKLCMMARGWLDGQRGRMGRWPA